MEAATALIHPGFTLAGAEPAVQEVAALRRANARRTRSDGQDAQRSDGACGNTLACSARSHAQESHAIAVDCSQKRVSSVARPLMVAADTGAVASVSAMSVLETNAGGWKDAMRGS